MDITPRSISEALTSQCESAVKEILPNGKKSGSEWVAGSVSGEAGDSLKVCLSGDKAGVWSDFATGETGGDLLDLYCAANNADLKTAIDWACQFLGVRRPEFQGHKHKTYVKPERPKTVRSLEKSPKVAAWLASRGLTERSIKAYKIAADGDAVVFPYMRRGELIHLKYRSVVEKKFWSSADTEKGLFGWQSIPATARSVAISEGELDSMSLYEYGFPALSIPIGGGSKGKQDWIETEYANLERFDTIYLCMDNDEAGAQATAEIIDRLGRHRCRVVNLPLKDANECLMKGVGVGIIQSAFKAAKTLDPSELRNAMDYRDEVALHFYPPNKAHVGFDLPWRGEAEKFQFGWGETTILAGQSGHGKSQVVGQIVADAINQGVLSCVASLEFKPAKWISRLVRQATCIEIPDRDRIDHAMKWLSSGLWAFDVSGKGAGTAKIDRLLEVFQYAYSRYGCKLFVLDNLTKCGIPEDGYSEQKAAITKITEWSVEHNVHTIVVAHMRKNSGHDGPSGKLDVRGSSAITDLADNVWALHRARNKEAKLIEIEHVLHSGLEDDERQKLEQEKLEWIKKADAFMICEKYRNGDIEPRIRLWFDRRSTQFLESQDTRPRGYA